MLPPRDCPGAWAHARSEISEIRSERLFEAPIVRSAEGFLPAPRGPRAEGTRAEGGGCRKRGRKPRLIQCFEPKSSERDARVRLALTIESSGRDSGSLSEAGGNARWRG
jgi:hypothetical protein